MMKPNLFEEAKKYFMAMKSSAGERNNFYDEVDAAYLLEWMDKPRDAEGLKLTTDPSARNAVLGIARLLSATDPIISITDTNQDQPDNETEQFLAQAWRFSGTVAGAKLTYDACLSAVLYGRVILTVSLTSEFEKVMRKTTSKANKRRLERLAETTPVLFRVLKPRNCYEERDPLGLVRFGYEAEMLPADVNRMYGTDLPDKGQPVCVYDLWDLEYHCTWVDGMDTPIIQAEHNLPAIPVATAMADGSSLFDDEDDRVQPFLYTLLKSELWSRGNLILTVMGTKLAQFGFTPPMEYNRVNNNILEIDYSQPVPIIYTGPGESIRPVNIPPINAETWKFRELIAGLSEASTIFSQTLGQPLGSNSTYSETALLSRSGQLPLQGPREAVAMAAKSIFDVTMDWLEDEGVKHKTLENIDLKADREIEVKLDVKMPMDTARNLQLIQQMSGAPNPVVSDEWMLENLAQVTDTDEMRRNVGKQIAYKARFMAGVQQMLQQAMQPKQQPQPAQPGGPGQPAGPTHQMPDGSMMAGAQHPGPMPGQPPAEMMAEPMMTRGEQGQAQEVQGAQRPSL